MLTALEICQVFWTLDDVMPKWIPIKRAGNPATQATGK
jgi:hypothetical protein